MSSITKQAKQLFKKYKQPIRGFLGWLFGMLAQVTTVGVDTIMTWDAKRWSFTLAIAALPGFMGFMKGGENNPSDEELYEKVHAVKKVRAQQGLEVTDPNGLPLKPAPVLPPETKP